MRYAISLVDQCVLYPTTIIAFQYYCLTKINNVRRQNALSVRSLILRRDRFGLGAISFYERPRFRTTLDDYRTKTKRSVISPFLASVGRSVALQKHDRGFLMPRYTYLNSNFFHHERGRDGSKKKIVINVQTFYAPRYRVVIN